MHNVTAETRPQPHGAPWLLFAYLGVLGLLVFLPFGRGMDLGDRLNLEPFATIDRALELGPRSSSFRLMLGNILAFVPFGILVPLLMRGSWWSGSLWSSEPSGCRPRSNSASSRFQCGSATPTAPPMLTTSS